MSEDAKKLTGRGSKGFGPRGDLFTKGGRGGPGRTPGLRPRFANSFLRALQDDFDAHGVKVIEAVRANNPLEYLKVCASIVPKAMVIQAEVTDARKSVSEYTTAELVAIISSGRDAGAGDSGGGTTLEGEVIASGLH